MKYLGNIGGVDREAGPETRSALQRLEAAIVKIEKTLSTVTRNDSVVMTSAPGLGDAPTALVTLTASNGAASTFIRSDAAPALSQAISPTWSSPHTWTPLSPATVPVTIRAAAAQTADLLDLYDSTGTLRLQVQSSGYLASIAPSSSPAWGLIADEPTSAGGWASPVSGWMGWGYDTSSHPVQWGQGISVTSNDGSSSYWSMYTILPSLAQVLNVTSGGITTSYGGFDANSKKITNVLTPAASTDAATKGYVDGITTGGANPSASVGLTAVNGSAVTYLRSDGAPALSQSIAPTWTGTHTFSLESVHNGGIDIGTSGRFDSNVADGAGVTSFLFKPTVALTSGTDRNRFMLQDAAGSNNFLACRADGTWQMGYGTSAVTGGLLNVTGTCTVGSYGINFIPVLSTAGVGLNGVTGNSILAGYFSARDENASGSVSAVGGFFEAVGVTASGTKAMTDLWGGIFRVARSGGVGSSETTVGGWKTLGFTRSGMGTAPTNAYGGYVGAHASGTNRYGIYNEEQTGGTINNGSFYACASTSYKAIAIRDQNAWIGSDAAGELTIGGTTCNIKSTNIGFWGAAGVAQYNTTGTVLGYTGGGGTALTHSDTFTGNTGATAYTIGDVVRALKLCGIIAA